MGEFIEKGYAVAIVGGRHQHTTTRTFPNRSRAIAAFVWNYQTYYATKLGYPKGWRFPETEFVKNTQIRREFWDFARTHSGLGGRPTTCRVEKVIRFSDAG